jgi:AcrR family transcriptional regulator
VGSVSGSTAAQDRLEYRPAHGDCGDPIEEPNGRRRGNGRAVEVSRDEIVAASLRLARGRGLARLTMRRLADELGTAPSTLYYHIAGKHDLMTLLRDAVLDTVELPDPGAGDWTDRFRLLSRNTFEVFSEYPGVVGTLLSDPSPSTRRVTDCVVDLLREAGFSGKDLYQAFTLVAVASSASFPAESPEPERGSARRDLPHIGSYDESPVVAELAGSEPSDLAEAHAFRIDVVIDGLQARLARGS